MPTYEFELDDGTIEEHYFTYSTAPRLGERVDLPGGSVGRRILSTSTTAFARRDVSFVCHSAPRVWQGEGKDPAPRRDPKGRPVLHSRREAVEFGRATGSIYDEL